MKSEHGGQPPDALQDEGGALSARATTLHLGPGLHVVEIAAFSEPVDMLQGLELPAVHVTALPGEIDNRGAVVVANSAGTGPWLPPDGGTIVVQSPLQGGGLLVTVYAPYDRPCSIPRITARRLDSDRPILGSRGAAGVDQPEPRTIDTEVVLHIHRVGDRRFVGQGWFGMRGRRLHIEAFSIRPLDTLAATDIEFMGFGPGNRQTPWVSDGRLCGTRGRGLPLTGFAVRLAPHVQGRFDIIYEGAFFASGGVGPRRNGEPCLPPVGDDPLEAINLRIAEGAAGSD